MGSNLAPTFSNFAMDIRVENWYSSKWTTTTFLHYVDDIFPIFSRNTHVDSFFNFINSIDKNLQFSTEFPSSYGLPFLDTNILLTNNSFSITSADKVQRATQRHQIHHQASIMQEQAKLIGFQGYVCWSQSKF